MNWVAVAQDNEVVASTSDELMCIMKGMKFF
jgi:hypothetical protein